jgi:ATPases involved in chromosome partitioning
METIALVNQKGGVAKTTTAVNLGIGLAKTGKAVLLVDTDPQGTMTSHLGYDPSEMESTTATLMQKMVDSEAVEPGEGVLHHKEGIDLIPANIDLSVMERDLWREYQPTGALAGMLAPIAQEYDYILLDCGPSLGILTLNALAAANSVIIPVQAEFQALRGSGQLLSTVYKAHKQINPGLHIRGIVMTMVDRRTNHARESEQDVRDTFAGRVKVFNTVIPRSVAAADASKAGTSIYEYAPRNKVALAYEQLVQEVIAHG